MAWLRSAKSRKPEDAKIIADLNMTPMIDVLLVLLILFIITIPMQTHAVKVDLPTSTVIPEILDTNRIAIDADRRLYWNGTEMDRSGMRDVLVTVGTMEHQPMLEFAPDAQAPFETVDQVMAYIKIAGIQSMGFVGNERHAAFDEAIRPAQLNQ